MAPNDPLNIWSHLRLEEKVIPCVCNTPANTHADKWILCATKGLGASMDWRAVSRILKCPGWLGYIQFMRTSFPVIGFTNYCGETLEVYVAAQL